MNNIHKNTVLSSLLALLSSVMFFTGCSQTSASVEPLRRTELMLGTTVTVSLYDHQSEEILDKAFDRITTLEDALSINKTGTLLDKVNAEAGNSPVKVDADTFDVIQKGLAYSALTDGSFDITIGPIVKLWNIGFPDARVPSQDEIQSKLPLVDYKQVVLDDAAQTIYLKQPGMLIDLGGIGKGYAADEVAAVLRSEGVEHAIIDLGGNLYMLGDKPGNSSWTVGVQDPFNPRGSIIGRLNVINKSVVTSGIYERYLEQDSVKYHHILNPKTGYPYTNEIAGVTIVSDYSIDGDAISTSVFSKGIEEGMDFVESQEGVDAIFITTDYKVYTSSGLKDNFSLTSTAFTPCELPQ